MKVIFTGSEKDLLDNGFEEKWYGLYGGDYLVEYEFKKEFWYRNKKYYFKCGRTLFGANFAETHRVFLYKDRGRKQDKQVHRKKIFEYGLQELINKGLVTYEIKGD